ncbi:TetR/AcrR family transcriptional regulator [Micromonospora sp. HM5-17]|jgi:AcrR family transcriptional regulator|uniref:TetR/AcrR family transcriptional regulator n=1 Tax=Micromonospora sp. HM5-17 TaxID=2487710 RepID=UPI000F47C862|nr:TetR/AcrR family transcriptional regulator [Micromonospora sp. HM5-17]ROT29799.1 TetR/AcrR family transcriptional regulator [Micromonospora sp. HM5-17]
MRSTSRGPGQRAGLTRADVLTAARALLAEGGIEALSMRSLARRLGVAPNTLYSYVRSKTELLDEVLDGVLAEVRAPEADTPDPVAGISALMTSTYTVLLGHPDLVPVFLARQGARGANAVRLGEILDTLLRRAGVDESDVGQARRVLIVHAIGSAAFAAVGPDGERPLAPADVTAQFTRGLGWLLAGITAGSSPPGGAG